MATITAVHPDSTTDDIEHLESEVIRRFGRKNMMELTVPRRDAQSASIKEDREEIELHNDAGNREFRGELKDIEWGKETTLIVHSFEKKAQEAEPTAQDDRYVNASDDTIIKDAISAVPALSAGTIENLQNGLTFVFSTASQAKKARTVVEATAGEIRYNDDKTVDFKSRLGSDRSGSVTISPDDQNLDGEIRVIKRSGPKNITHLRVLGAGEGKHQIIGNIVPAADGASYTNKQTYTSSWSSSEDEQWDIAVNKDITDPQTLQDWGLNVIDELNSKFVEAEATVKGVDLNLGDTIHVTKRSQDIDNDLRIVELVRIQDKEGVRYECTLSNRQVTREDTDTEVRKNTERYKKAFEGTALAINTAGGRQPVDGSTNYRTKVYYPAEVEFEHRLNIRVIGLPYRAYSAGGANSSGSQSTTGTGVPQTALNVASASPSSDVTISDGDFHTIDAGGLPASNKGHAITIMDSFISFDTFGKYDMNTKWSAGTHSNKSSHLISSTESAIDTDEATETFSAEDTSIAELTVENVSGSSKVLKSGSSIDFSFYYEHDHTFDPNDHTHPVDPGLKEFSNELPSNCDVLVNGNSQGVSFGGGSSEFEELVDVTGELTEGAINTIEVTSDTLGHMAVYVEGDVYRQVLGNG